MTPQVHARDLIGDLIMEVSLLCEETKFGGVVGFYIDESIYNWKKFSEYFVPLAEWRESQINSILDD